MTNEMPNEIYVTEPVKGTGTGTGFYAQTDFDGSTKYIRADSIHADVAVAFGAIEKGLMSLSLLRSVIVISLVLVLKGLGLQILVVK